LRPADPFAGGERGDLLLVEPASRFVINVLDACRSDLQVSTAQQPRFALIVAVQSFSINDERDTLLERECLDCRGLLLLLERLEHAMQLQALE